MQHNKQPHPYLVEFISAGKISVLDEGGENICDKFLQHITDQYPLVAPLGDSVDWEKIENSESKNIELLTEQDIKNLILSFTVSNYSYAAMIYTLDAPCYIFSISTFIEEFEYLIGIVPHTAYFIGTVVDENGIYKLNFDEFIECERDSSTILSGRKK